MQRRSNNMNRTLDMILRNLKVEMARIDKENKEYKEANHILTSQNTLLHVTIKDLKDHISSLTIQRELKKENL